MKIPSHPKSYIFIFLFSLFAFYSVLVYTEGTSGKHYSDSFRKGQLVWQKNNCQVCHQLYGLGGHKGPDLTNLMSVPEKGEAYARILIESGTSEMPAFKMGKNELNDLMRFLREVDQSGKSQVRADEVDNLGNYTLNQ